MSTHLRSIYITKPNGIKILDHYELIDDAKLFKFYRTYAKTLKKHPYYISAKNKREANMRFNNVFSWLTVGDKPAECDEEETREVLHNPRRYSVR